MRMSKLAIAAAGLTLCAGPALAQDADLEDARCIVIGYVVANQKDGALPGAMIISYFQGRIDGRGGTLNLRDHDACERTSGRRRIRCGVSPGITSRQPNGGWSSSSSRT